MKCECTITTQCECDGLCERQAECDVTNRDGDTKQMCERCGDNAVGSGQYRFGSGERTIAEKWDELDADLREALVEWYNRRPEDIGDDDRGALLGLVDAEHFWFWDCPVCDEQCVHGSPEDWSDFQGVNGQDYISYPGDPDIFTTEARIAMCDACRRKSFGMPGEGEYPPVWALV